MILLRCDDCGRSQLVEARQAARGCRCPCGGTLLDASRRTRHAPFARIPVVTPATPPAAVLVRPAPPSLTARAPAWIGVGLIAVCLLIAGRATWSRFAGASSTGALTDPNDDEAVESAIPIVVAGFSYNGPGGKRVVEPIAWGSGFAISADGLVMTGSSVIGEVQAGVDPYEVYARRVAIPRHKQSLLDELQELNRANGDYGERQVAIQDELKELSEPFDSRVVVRHSESQEKERFALSAGVWLLFRDRETPVEAPVVFSGTTSAALAILRCDLTFSRYFSLDADRSSRFGQDVTAHGHPLGPCPSDPIALDSLRSTVDDRSWPVFSEAGKVGATEKHSDGALGECIKHSAKTQRGFEGGPLLTRDGSVLGVQVPVPASTEGMATVSIPHLKEAIEVYLPASSWRDD